MLATVEFSLLSSGFSSRNVKFKIYKPVIIPVLYVYGTWSPTVRKNTD